MNVNRQAARSLGLVLSVAFALVAGATGPGDLPAAPGRLSETGLYADPASHRVDPRNHPFEPQYPLWTDGAEKSRWIYLPPGTTIDAHDTDLWSFPVGTKLWKEFSFDGKRVETRMIWHASSNGWVFASYAWNDDGTEATLAPASGVRNKVRIGENASHSIPSVADCLTCHGGSSPVLGFSALQLSDDRDPLAPHARPLREGMLTIRELDRLGLLEPRRPDLVANPPRIRAGSPRERAALGYFAGNCGHCHNPSGALVTLGMNLSQNATTDSSTLESTIDVASLWKIPGVGTDSRRVAPGSPDHSAVVARMSSRRPSTQMPPLGTSVPDEEALALIRIWIADDLPRELEADPERPSSSKPPAVAHGPAQPHVPRTGRTDDVSRMD